MFGGVQYLDAHADRIVDIYEERTQVSGMPGWPDGGGSGHEFMGGTGAIPRPLGRGYAPSLSRIDHRSKANPEFPTVAFK